MKRLALVFLLVCLAAAGAFGPAQASKYGRVYLVPTLHGLHKTNPNYTYHSLRNLIGRLNPDIIAVEIRPEDIGQDTSYLKQNYPYEMWMMRYWFPQTQVLGFDWLGTDLEGKLIPANYWAEQAPVKKYQKALAADSVYASRTAACDALVQERMKLLKTLSLNDLLSSRDSALTAQYYHCLANALNGSAHTRLLDFYTLRNQKLLQNITTLTNRHKGKTIVILTGDDHYVYLSSRFAHRALFSR